MNTSPAVKYLLRYVALGYLLVLLIVPVGVILYRTFEPGIGAFFRLDRPRPLRSPRCSCRC